MAIAEISGADSIAAALQFAAEHPGVGRIVPTYVATGTEFGDFGAIEGNLSFLREALMQRHGIQLGNLVRAEDPSLWRAINGRYASVLTRAFGAWYPCVGCHLYLHLMRIPLAREHGMSTVISGERERHDDRTKANQVPEALDAYVEVLAAAGIQLALPLRRMDHSTDIDRILGDMWPGGSPQLSCVLSGNERSIDGTSVAEVPRSLMTDYIVPVGKAVVQAMDRGARDWDRVVADVLKANGLV